MAGMRAGSMPQVVQELPTHRVFAHGGQYLQEYYMSVSVTC